MHFILLFKAKSEPRAAASSAGLLKLQHTQPASSTLANTVRIEKLSDEEDEEVDITDDLCNDDSDHKPPVDNACESKGLEEIPIQTENLKEEQDNGLSMSSDHLSHAGREETGVREKLSPHGHPLMAARTNSELITQEDESLQSEGSRQHGEREEGASDDTGKPAAVK